MGGFVLREREWVTDLKSYRIVRGPKSHAISNTKYTAATKH